MNKSLDDIIKDRKQTRNFPRRGNGKFRRNGDNRRDRFDRDRRGFRGDRRGGDRRGFRGNRRGRGDRGFRGNRDRGDRNNFRRPRRSFDRTRKLSGDMFSSTRLFVNDLPKTVSNNDLRVFLFNLGNF